MNGRRGFFAFVGGTTVTGLVGHRAWVAAPTLILPPTGIIEPARLGSSPWPLLGAEKSQMHAFLHVKMRMPDTLFLNWLEGGLRMAENCKPGGGCV